ncbi:hypothetical protein ACH5RR_017950 [Cinchona calisaya]|uniref:Uncharacterized protein n=1 Tax=Cinchona calisaya TaxID=153742 RepID=A0ABD2ZK18_9GENT
MSNPSQVKKLHNKVAIITGGASGFGEATASRFAEQGARAVAIADIQEEKGQKGELCGAGAGGNADDVPRVPDECGDVERSFEADFAVKKSGFLKAKNVADAVLFLASDDSQFVTGHSLAVDAGYVPSNGPKY